MKSKKLDNVIVNYSFFLLVIRTIVISKKSCNLQRIFINVGNKERDISMIEFPLVDRIHPPPLSLSVHKARQQL